MVAKVVLFCVLVASGFLLSTLGLIATPVVNNANYFWPAAAVQAVGSVLFGWTGILAGTVFPALSNAATDPTLMSVYRYTPANFVNCFLAYVLYSRFLNPRITIARPVDALKFVVGAGLVPHFCGGLCAALVLYMTGGTTTLAETAHSVLMWVLDSVPWITLFGVPVVAIYAPMLQRAGLLLAGADSQPDFRGKPSQ